jgi:hypothetical protein
MELTLTSTTIEHKKHTMTLKAGMEIHFYRDRYGSPSNYDVGYVRIEDGKYFIDWEDCSDPTELDGSDHANSVLKDCGFF